MPIRHVSRTECATNMEDRWRKSTSESIVAGKFASARLPELQDLWRQTVGPVQPAITSQSAICSSNQQLKRSHSVRRRGRRYGARLPLSVQQMLVSEIFLLQAINPAGGGGALLENYTRGRQDSTNHMGNDRGKRAEWISGFRVIMNNTSITGTVSASA